MYVIQLNGLKVLYHLDASSVPEFTKDLAENKEGLFSLILVSSADDVKENLTPKEIKELYQRLFGKSPDGMSLDDLCDDVYDEIDFEGADDYEGNLSFESVVIKPKPTRARNTISVDKLKVSLYTVGEKRSRTKTSAGFTLQQIIGGNQCSKSFNEIFEDFEFEFVPRNDAEIDEAYFIKCMKAALKAGHIVFYEEEDEL